MEFKVSATATTQLADRCEGSKLKRSFADGRRRMGSSTIRYPQHTESAYVAA